MMAELDQRRRGAEPGTRRTAMSHVGKRPGGAGRGRRDVATTRPRGSWPRPEPGLGRRSARDVEHWGDARSTTSQTPVSGEQFGAQPLRQSGVRRVVGAQALAEGPDPRGEGRVWVPDQRQVSQDLERLLSASRRELSPRHPAAQRVQHLGVNQVRRVERDFSLYSSLDGGGAGAAEQKVEQRGGVGDDQRSSRPARTESALDSPASADSAAPRRSSISAMVGR